MPTLQSKIQVHGENFDATGYSDQNSLVRALADKPDQLTPTLTHLMGAWNWANRFPLLALTEGQAGGIKEVAINSLQYEYPVIGKRKTTETVSSTQYGTGDKPGLNNTPFFVTYANKWFAPSQTLRSRSGIQARVMEEPVSAAGGGWRYKLQMFNPDPTASVPLGDLLPGAVWGIGGGSTVTQSLSVGNWSPVQTPGKRKNQISFIRKSFRLAGNVANKIVTFTLVDANQRATNLWLDWETFQHMLAYREEKELHLWTSEYSRNEYGQNPLIDPATQQIIPTGAGLFQQIPNYDTYSFLTEKKIKTTLGDVFRGAPDTMKMDIVLYTGEGGAEEFDTAMKGSKIFNQVAFSTGDNFVRSAGGNLMLGGYFTSYQSVDGHIVTIKKLPFLDLGGYADASPRHPISGRPLSSYEMYFVDMSKYDGVPNLQLVYEKGRMEVRGVRQGMTVVPGTTYGDFNGMKGFIPLATEQDETSVHYMASCGIQMLRNTHSFKLLPDVSALGV